VVGQEWQVDLNQRRAHWRPYAVCHSALGGMGETIMRTRSTALLAICIGALLQPALASAPVRKTIVGCVSNGAFTSEDGYVITLYQRSGRLLDLSRWQNMRLRAAGALLPGDNFYVDGTPTVLGPCR
jgi:hypothetical protein